MLHVVLCEIWGCCPVPWCRRGEVVKKKKGGGGGVGWGLFESRPWYGKTLALVKGQIDGFSTT